MAELLVVLFILVLVFGSSKIPAIGDGIGRAVRGVKRALGGGTDDEPKP